MHYFILSGSTREGVNLRLGREIGRRLVTHGHEVRSVVDVRFRTSDLLGRSRKERGSTGSRRAFPELTWNLVNGFVCVSPEYNFSIPGGLKNLIDWVSRFRPYPFAQIPTLLASASPSPLGGNRGLWALRVPLEALGTLVHPDMYSLARVNETLPTNDELRTRNFQNDSIRYSSSFRPIPKR